MSQNRIVLYSNGIADFQRAVKVNGDQPTEVSIPVSKLHLADVLASLNIYGDVRFDSAPTFRPDTGFDGSITINPKDSFNTLASELSGSKVAIEKAGGTVEGLLLGTHETQIATTGSPCTKKYLVVSTNQGVKNIAYSDIVSLESKDDIVKAEIERHSSEITKRLNRTARLLTFRSLRFLKRTTQKKFLKRFFNTQYPSLPGKFRID